MNRTYLTPPNADPRLAKLGQAGQSLWSDVLSRDEIRSGRLAALIAAGVTGVTSNPVIFEQAISKSNDYDNDIKAMLAKNPKLSPKEVYENLAIADIQEAAGLLRPIYEQTGDCDGFVSLEVDPHLAYDRDATINEAIDLFTRIDRPNVMIKIPATTEGIQAMKILSGNRIGNYSININMTLIFTLEQYQSIIEAWQTGLKKTYPSIYPSDAPQCVASFFMSRIDVLVEKHLGELLAAGRLLPFEAEYLMPPLAPSLALAAAEQAYKLWREKSEETSPFATPRLLWASTGTKNKNLPDTYYMENLIAKDTINTVPPATLAAFRDHGNVKPSQLNFAHLADNKCLQDLAGHGMTLEKLGARLLPDGLTIFAEAQDRLLAAIAAKMS
ncbi:MAG: transaldolase [Alphaproteobacteria bacterium]|nr:transaldolase [Alphaproteobacteria bacterium]